MLAYKQLGKRSDKSPLFIGHGLLGDGSNWGAIAKHFAQSREVMVFDQRNHGDSPHTTGMEYEQLVADVLALQDFLDIEKADHLGHSMGGKVAMILALKHPDRITNLIVVDIAPAPSKGAHRGILSAMANTPLTGMKSRRAVDEWLQPTIKNDFERGFLLKNLSHKNGRLAWRANITELSQSYDNLSGFPAFSEQTQNTLPCLFIRGAESDYLTDLSWPKCISLFPQASLVSIKNSTHYPHVQNRNDFIEAITRWENQIDTFPLEN